MASSLCAQLASGSPASAEPPLMAGSCCGSRMTHSAALPLMSIAPEAEPLLLRGAAVAALAAIAPPLALLALIETGPGKDLNCGGVPSSKELRKSERKAKAEEKKDDPQPAQKIGPKPLT